MDYQLSRSFGTDGNGIVYNGQREQGLQIKPERFAQDFTNDLRSNYHFLSIHLLNE